MAHADALRHGHLVLGVDHLEVGEGAKGWLFGQLFQRQGLLLLQLLREVLFKVHSMKLLHENRVVRVSNLLAGSEFGENDLVNVLGQLLNVDLAHLLVRGVGEGQGLAETLGR